jgi:N-carbamoyl-L-amino-acid hydrolase
MNLSIDSERLLAELATLASFSDADAPGVTRIVFTQTDLNARAWLMKLCEGAGLVVRQDAIGNMFARWIGSSPEAPVVGTGSHIDAIPNAGKYDGVVGVLAGLEGIRAFPSIRLSCWLLPRKSQRALESGAWVAGCFPGVCLRMLPES